MFTETEEEFATKDIAWIFRAAGWLSLAYIIFYFLFGSMVDVPDEIRGPAMLTKLFDVELTLFSICSLYLAARPPVFRTMRALYLFQICYGAFLIANIILPLDSNTCLASYSIECSPSL